MDGFERRAVGIAEDVALDFAEQRGEFSHPILGELLIAHDNEMMQEERIPDALRDLAGERAVQVDAVDFGAESARKWSNHWSNRKLASPGTRRAGIGLHSGAFGDSVHSTKL